MILVDIPIGLPRGIHGRDCEREARAWIGERRESVFPAPCAEALDVFRAGLGDQGPYPPAPGSSKEHEQEWKKAVKDAKIEVQRSFNKKSRNGLSAQVVGLLPKVLEMEQFLKEHGKVVREFHPEVSFRKLSRKVLAFHKTDIHGAWLRARILEWFGVSWPRIRAALRADARDVGNLPQKIPYDDVLDATVGALTAQLGSTARGELHPSPPQEMEMVYFTPPEEHLYPG